MPLVPSAVIAAVAFGVLLVIVLVPIPGLPSPTLSDRLLNAVVVLLSGVATVYSIHCMVRGECFVWSWVVAVLIAVWAAVVAATSVYLTFNPQALKAATGP